MPKNIATSSVPLAFLGGQDSTSPPHSHLLLSFQQSPELTSVLSGMKAVTLSTPHQSPQDQLGGRLVGTYLTWPALTICTPWRSQLSQG